VHARLWIETKRREIERSESSDKLAQAKGKNLDTERRIKGEAKV